MSNFNFGTVSAINTNASGNFMKPYDIYKDVKFKGVGEPVTGSTKDGGTWKAWDFTFEGPSGSYKERIFEPTEKSTERRTIQNKNGHESVMPSDFERTLYFAAQLVEAYRPEKEDVYKTACSKITTFDQFIDILKKVLNPDAIKDVTAELLLSGRKTQDGKIYASLPNFVRINSTTNEIYTSEKFIGHNLSMSAYELGEQEKYNNRKPTPMSSTAPETSTKGSEDAIDDFATLL